MPLLSAPGTTRTCDLGMRRPVPPRTPKPYCAANPESGGADCKPCLGLVGRAILAITRIRVVRLGAVFTVHVDSEKVALNRDALLGTVRT